MTNASEISYVKKADLDDIYVLVRNPSIDSALERLGFRFDVSDGLHKLHTQNDPEKAAVFEKLRSLRIPFMGGSDWSPAEVFEYLRDDLQLLSGPFEKVVWLNPDTVKIEIA